MNEERFILAWNTPLPDAAFKLTIYLENLARQKPFPETGFSATFRSWV
jgi:hypothetical protein